MKKSKALEAEIERAFAVHFNRVQIPIMDIPKIFREAREAHARGLDINNFLQELASNYLFAQAQREAGV